MKSQPIISHMVGVTYGASLTVASPQDNWISLTGIRWPQLLNITLVGLDLTRGFAILKTSISLSGLMACFTVEYHNQVLISSTNVEVVACVRDIHVHAPGSKHAFGFRNHTKQWRWLRYCRRQDR